ncbi:MAG: transketolase C-terminal domain-containing protein, partial [Pseudomonadota bacterium]|nr:transketolase C-terminal domain-containing protein [Pseudomonadota bacterium]
VPVFLMAEEAIAHLQERIDIAPSLEIINRLKLSGAPPFGHQLPDGVPPMPAFGEGEKLLVTGSTHDANGFRKTDDPAIQAQLVQRINNKIISHRDEIIQTESTMLEDADIVIIAYGFSARSALFALEKLRQEGKKVGLLRLKTIWPFADQIVEQIGKSAKKILVPEMNLGQIAGEIRKYTACDVISYQQSNGKVIHPQRIIEEIRSL